MLSRASFVALGTLNTVAVDDEAVLPDAVSLVKSQLREIDEACSRFRPDSELSRLNARCGGAPVELSPILEEAILAGIQAADMTDGLVDLTVGASMEEIGYTVTFRDLPADGPPLQLCVRRLIGWRAIEYDAATHTLRMPAKTSIDLGASGKAWAADRAAECVAETLGVGVLVDCGGDIAVRGAAPNGGWPVLVVSDIDSDDGENIALFDGGLATSGTTSRRWRRGGVQLHHIIDPSTSLPAHTPWSMVSVAAATCLEANAAATAAMIMGKRAPEWLEHFNLPARLVDEWGSIHRVASWPA